MNEIFLTKYYKVLEILSQNTVTIETGEFCPMSQETIAEIMHTTRMSLSKIFSVLKEQGYIQMIERGKWKVTNKGLHVVNVISKLQEGEEGDEGDKLG